MKTLENQLRGLAETSAEIINKYLKGEIADSDQVESASLAINEYLKHLRHKSSQGRRIGGGIQKEINKTEKEVRSITLEGKLRENAELSTDVLKKYLDNKTVLVDLVKIAKLSITQCIKHHATVKLREGEEYGSRSKNKSPRRSRQNTERGKKCIKRKKL